MLTPLSTRASVTLKSLGSKELASAVAVKAPSEAEIENFMVDNERQVPTQKDRTRRRDRYREPGTTKG